MGEAVTPIQPGAAATWVRAIRAFSFTASLMPVTVGATLAMSADSPVRWELLPLVAIASLLLHAATNLVSDAGDYHRGLDRPGAHGGSGVLVEGLLTTRQVFAAGLGAFAAASLLGLVMIWIRGLGVLWLGRPGWRADSSMAARDTDISTTRWATSWCSS